MSAGPADTVSGGSANAAAPDGRPRRAAVVVASTSAAAGLAEDLTGPAIRDWLRNRGFDAAEPAIVADGEAVGAAVRAALVAGAAVVVTTGGTGVSPSDRTPEQVEPLLDQRLPGIVEEIRRRGLASTPMSVITRGVAGFAGDAFVVTLPGSPGGVRDGLAVLEDVLEHLLDQRTGTRPGHGDSRNGAPEPSER